VKRVSGKDLCKALERNGWYLDRIRGSHHVYKKPGSPLSIPVPVHGNHTLKPGTQRDIMKDAGLTEADL
jgi:predicted RNA binding protein YcfA (HicA-like mRNA interferase family)